MTFIMKILSFYLEEHTVLCPNGFDLLVIVLIAIVCREVVSAIVLVVLWKLDKLSCLQKNVAVPINEPACNSVTIHENLINQIQFPN
jgi:hypothetical protein